MQQVATYKCVLNKIYLVVFTEFFRVLKHKHETIL